MKNVVILICSQLLIKSLGLIYKLVITNMEGFGDVGVGYYSAGYQIYALLLTLSSIGIPSVIHAAIHNHTCRGKEYEHFYTERWADKLGGVERK